MKRSIGIAAALAVILMVGGCVSDSETPNLFTKVKRDPDDPDKHKPSCDYTLEGGQPKTVCF